MEPDPSSPQIESPVEVLGILPPVPTPESRSLEWIFMGGNGLRAGWSVLLFFALTLLVLIALATASELAAHRLGHVKTGNFTPLSVLLQELISILAVTVAAAIVAHIEHRRILDYNLIDQRARFHFFFGLIAGFVSLSVLIGSLAQGGWIHFGAPSLMGPQIWTYAALWGAAFLLTSLFEEGTFRCFLQFTLTRGINFWWALGVIAALCLDLMIRTRGSAVWGVYAMALLGLVPCLWLHLKKSQSAGFWYAAWVTSTLFGFTHTGNGGENWIGVFAAAAIGFVFCVSVRLTGSAWWAIGFHASWDWAETYFYGTADSGNVATGHYLTTTPIGAALWSGGTDGPEGSLLILPLIALLLIALIVLYRRKQAASLVLENN